MFKSKVNRKYDFLIENIGDILKVNGQEKEIDVHPIDENTLHIIYQNHSYKVRILRHNDQNKELEVRINGQNYQVELQNENDLLLEKMGITKTVKKNIDVLKAPMPGLIVDIKVCVGQEVKEGEPLIILKAMKMENVLKSPCKAIVKQILVDRNQKIEKDAVIIQF